MASPNVRPTNFELDESSRELLNRSQQAGAELASLAKDGQPGRVNRPLILALAEAGLVPSLFPADQQVSALGLCLIRQGLARTSTAAETAFAMQGLGSYPIFQSGSPEMRKRWIPAIAAGESVPAFALTEPSAGSDAGHLSMRAERDGSGYRLTGEKVYISNAPDADVYTVFARTTPDAGSRGVSAFVVPGDAPGLTGKPIALISPHPVGMLQFEGVPVSDDQMIGAIDQGFRVAMQTLDLFRPSVGAFAVGMAEAALNLAVEHAKTREAFGQPIASFQAVSHQLAEMAMRIDAARLLVYQAALAHDHHRKDDLTGMAAAAKLFATETAQFVIDAAVQIHGAHALEIGHPLADLYQEVRAPRIYEGTSEIQRNIIAREVLAGRWIR
jgi:alkylation response protein AidB-like acyl-CoA dehydrogenase